MSYPLITREPSRRFFRISGEFDDIYLRMLVSSTKIRGMEKLDLSAIFQTIMRPFRRLVREDEGMPGLIRENEHLKAELADLKQTLSAATFGADGFPPGHFYSPVVSLEDIKARESHIWKKRKEADIPGIDFNTEAQLALMSALEKYYPEMPFTPEKQDGIRYYFENDFYSYLDGISLHCMIRHFRPARIVEIGSGFSSAVMMDTGQLFFGNGIRLNFIEPYPERLHALMRPEDHDACRVIPSFVQDCPMDIFTELQENDILFVDSSHVVKTDSDLTHIFFEILPRLKSGVLVHFHDIFFPFVYPREWIFAGRNWNETYMLRAFLQYNDSFRMILFNTFLAAEHPGVFDRMPLASRNFGGGFWMKRI